MRIWVVQCSLVALSALITPSVSFGIDADFDAGNTSMAVDGYVGMSGDGWTTEWQPALTIDGGTGLPVGEPAVSVLTSGDPGYAELAAGSGNYLSFAATNTSKCAVSRGYDVFAADFDATKPHTISWKIRIDEDVQNGGTYDIYEDRYFICDSPQPVNGTTYDNSWSVFSFATDKGPLLAKNWGVFDGSLDNSALTESRIIDTGVPLVGGTVYDMEITVDPARRMYATSISDGTNTFYQEALRFRTAEYSVGRFLSFGIHSVEETDQRQFSLDDISIQQTTINWAPLPTQIEARFSDGNSDLVDGFRGVAGNGWAAGWSLRGNGNGSMTNIAPPTQVVEQGYPEFLGEVSSGSGAYLDYRMSPVNDGTGQASAARQYDLAYGEFDASAEHTIEFEVRIDEDLTSGQFSGFEDRYAFFGAPALYDGTKAGCSWMIMAFGADDGTGGLQAPLNWVLFDGLKDGGAFDLTRFVDSGMTVQSGVTYQFEVTVDPVNGEYNATISDGTNSYTATDLGFRTADFDNRYLTFNGRGNTADEMRHMSIDNILIYNEAGGPQPLAGDLNGDGLVGSADLDIVRGNWGQSVTPGNGGAGDPSGDGSVGSADLDIVRANWGNTAAAAVPEPSALVLLTLAAIGLALRRRR